MRVRSVAMNAELPALEDARMQILKIVPSQKPYGLAATARLDLRSLALTFLIGYSRDFWGR
jgi:hypothetical protein